MQDAGKQVKHRQTCLQRDCAARTLWVALSSSEGELSYVYELGVACLGLFTTYLLVNILVRCDRDPKTI